MISVYNIHRSPAVWDAPNEFRPERFSLDEPVPTEQTTDYRRAARPGPSSQRKLPRSSAECLLRVVAKGAGGSPGLG